MNEFIRTRREQGVTYSFTDLINMALEARNPVPWFDVEALTFNDAGGDFCKKMNQYFAETGQRQLTEDGEFVRSIYESIVLKIRHYAEALKELEITFERINVINGAVRNELLMQLISNGLDSEIYAGMEYATLAGNLLTQLYALGEVKTVKEMRSLSARSFQMKVYRPENRIYWQEAAEQYEKTIK